MDMMEILRKLGNPNKDYRTSSPDTILFLNYLELGMDLAFTNGGD